MRLFTKAAPCVAALILALAAPSFAAQTSSKSRAANTRAKAVVVSKKKVSKTVAIAPRAKKTQVASARGARRASFDMASLAGALPRLQSASALVIDQDTAEVLLSKNENAVVPIASLTKLMTGMLISQAQLPMEEMITITEADIDTEKNSHSRLAVGTSLSRGELLHLALMSSENRAAHALGRTYPGGLDHFVSLMNSTARSLGMNDTRYVDPTGLSSRNRSNAEDLALIVKAAYRDPVLRELSTAVDHEVQTGRSTLQYRTTNALVRDPSWHIGLQKTGYISEAGRCMVMQVKVSGRKLIMVLLDAASAGARTADAKQIRRFLEAKQAHTILNGSDQT